MTLPYFPMFPADFEADTSHLTLEEDGAYNRLLRLMWMTPGCSLPDDPAWIARRMRIDAATFDRVVGPLIAEFCKRASGRIYSPRLRAIWEETSEKHKRRVEAGRKGGRPRKSLNGNSSGRSNAKAMSKQPEPEPEPDIREDTNVSLSPVPADPVSEAVHAYNATASEAGWPKVQTLNKARRSALSARLREAGGIEGWRMALAKARASPLCTGQNDRGWTANFDFLIRQSSFAKLMEGNYDGKPAKHTGQSDALRDALDVAGRMRRTSQPNWL